jgi:hypothetical protein
LAAAIEVALIRLAGDDDVGVFVILVGWGGVGWSSVSWGRVAGSRVAWGSVGWGFVFRLVAGRSSGSDGQDSGDNKLENKIISLSKLNRMSPAQMISTIAGQLIQPLAVLFAYQLHVEFG